MLRLKLTTGIAAWILIAAVGMSAQEPFPMAPVDLSRPPDFGAGGEDFAVSARLEPEAQAPGHPVTAVVRFSCPEQWYIYVGSISVEVLAAEGEATPVKAGDLHLPRAKSRYDEVIGEQLEYLEGEFEARLALDILKDAPQGERTVKLRVGYQGCKPNLCFLPTTRDLEVRLSVLAPGAEPAVVPAVPATSGATGYEDEFAQSNLLVAVAIAFVAGLGLALTPCVYPLIPITVGVIGATAGRRLDALLRSLLYVFGISVTYAVLGLVAASAGEAFGVLLQSPVLYLGLAAVFIVLAAAMFGLFTIQMPASWTARLQGKVQGRWGLLGIFVLGLLSGVAVTACIAPVVSGALLYVFKRRDMAAGFLVLFAIAWGMGTPLVVLGTFSGLVKALPKSGGWQQVVKYVFGVALLVGAGYFVLRSGVVPVEKDLPGAWVTSEAQALKESREQGKPVMLYFWQQRCPACSELKAKTFPDERILAEEERFVCARIDGTRWNADERKRMQAEYGVQGFPTIAFIGSDGKIIHDLKVEGYVRPDVLLKAMRSVR